MQIVLRVEIKCVKVKLTCEEENKRHRQAKEENKRLREK